MPKRKQKKLRPSSVFSLSFVYSESISIYRRNSRAFSRNFHSQTELEKHTRITDFSVIINKIIYYFPRTITLFPIFFFFCYLLCVFRYWLRDFSNLLANTYIVVARCVPCEINVMSSEKKLILLIQLQHKKNNNYTLMYIFLQMHLVRAIKQIIKVHWKLRFCRFAFS